MHDAYSMSGGHTSQDLPKQWHDHRFRHSSSLVENLPERSSFHEFSDEVNGLVATGEADHSLETRVIEQRERPAIILERLQNFFDRPILGALAENDFSAVSPVARLENVPRVVALGDNYVWTDFSSHHRITCEQFTCLGGFRHETGPR